jgi:hypothetical protein
VFLDILVTVTFLDINKVLMTPKSFPNAKKYVVDTFDPKMTEDSFNEITHF